MKVKISIFIDSQKNTSNWPGVGEIDRRKKHLVVKSPSVLLVLFWTTAYVFLSGVFLYQMVTLVNEYLEFKVDTQISLIRNTKVKIINLTTFDSGIETYPSY